MLFVHFKRRFLYHIVPKFIFFDERIEITSFGSLPKGLTESEVWAEEFLAEVFYGVRKNLQCGLENGLSLLSAGDQSKETRLMMSDKSFNGGALFSF